MAQNNFVAFVTVENLPMWFTKKKKKRPVFLERISFNSCAWKDHPRQVIFLATCNNSRTDKIEIVSLSDESPDSGAAAPDFEQASAGNSSKKYSNIFFPLV